MQREERTPNESVHRRVEECQRRIANLTEALAKAGWSEGLASKLREEEASLAKLKTERTSDARRTGMRPIPDRATLARFVKNLFALLDADPARGNATLSRFLAPVVMTPEVDGPARRYRASGAFDLSFCLNGIEVADKSSCAGLQFDFPVQQFQ